mgnify:CR=1 FL=1
MPCPPSCEGSVIRFFLRRVTLVFYESYLLLEFSVQGIIYFISKFIKIKVSEYLPNFSSLRIHLFSLKIKGTKEGKPNTHRKSLAAYSQAEDIWSGDSLSHARHFHDPFTVPYENSATHHQTILASPLTNLYYNKQSKKWAPTSPPSSAASSAPPPGGTHNAAMHTANSNLPSHTPTSFAARSSSSTKSPPSLPPHPPLSHQPPLPHQQTQNVRTNSPASSSSPAPLPPFGITSPSRSPLPLSHLPISAPPPGRPFSRKRFCAPSPRRSKLGSRLEQRRRLWRRRRGMWRGGLGSILLWLELWRW